MIITYFCIADTGDTYNSVTKSIKTMKNNLYLQSTKYLDWTTRSKKSSSIWSFEILRVKSPLHRRSRSLLRICPWAGDSGEGGRRLEDMEERDGRDISISHHQLSDAHWGNYLEHSTSINFRFQNLNFSREYWWRTVRPWEAWIWKV